MTLHGSATAFLNALLREWDGWSFLDPMECRRLGLDDRAVISLPLDPPGVRLLVCVRHRSLVGRHAFDPPLLWQAAPDAACHEVPDALMVTLIAHTSEITGDAPLAQRLLFIRRVIESFMTTHAAIDARSDRLERLFAPDQSFIEAEQALVLGHPVHPSPRSHDEFTEEETRRYAPVFGAQFRLRWLAADQNLVSEGSVGDQTPGEMVRALILDDPELGRDFLERVTADGRRPLPCHPWQARSLLDRSELQTIVKAGRLVDLGEAGSPFHATSSVRTLYAPHARYMLKCALSVRVTNSKRVLRAKEIERGKEIHQLLESGLGREIAERFPSLHLIGEPGHIALGHPDDAGMIEESAVVFRTNPFHEAGRLSTGPSGEVAPAGPIMLATLCQDHPYGGRSMLTRIVEGIAERDGRETEPVAVEWFERFLVTAVEPILSVQADYGLLFGAHQQNTMLGMTEGWPAKLYFRDCQGTGHMASAHARLARMVPDIGKNAENVLGTQLGHELFGYYVVINNVFNVIATLAIASLANEATLLASFRRMLEKLAEAGHEDPSFYHYLLGSKTLRSKGNFLTCFSNINENAGEGTEQLAAFVDLPNPLFSLEETTDGATLSLGRGS